MNDANCHLIVTGVDRWIVGTSSNRSHHAGITRTPERGSGGWPLVHSCALWVRGLALFAFEFCNDIVYDIKWCMSDANVMMGRMHMGGASAMQRGLPGQCIMCCPHVILQVGGLCMVYGAMVLCGVPRRRDLAWCSPRLVLEAESGGCTAHASEVAETMPQKGKGNSS